MIRATRILFPMAAMLSGSAALAQATPTIGSVDSSRATRETRQQNEDFNKLVGSVNKRRNNRPVAATAADIVAGRQVDDSKGVALGMVESVGSDGAVVASGALRVRVPLDAFGVNRRGLLLAITKAEFDAAAAQAQ